MRPFLYRSFTRAHDGSSIAMSLEHFDFGVRPFVIEHLSLRRSHQDKSWRTRKWNMRKRIRHPSKQWLRPTDPYRPSKMN